jgi:cell division protein FtsL
MDAFRRQVNQKILNLEKRIDQQNVQAQNLGQ